jgi:hypothetical protein
MRFPRLYTALAMLSALVFVNCDKSSDFETYTATLQGGQENPPVNSSGTATATVLLSKSGDRLDVSVTMTGLVNVTQAHIHRAPRGTNGGVIFWLYQPNNPLYPATPNQLAKSWLNPSIDSRDQALTQSVIDDLRAGNLYVNYHTTVNPGGEIRGQLTRQQ